MTTDEVRVRDEGTIRKPGGRCERCRERRIAKALRAPTKLLEETW